MGQKVNPHGIRLGINKTWSSRWFSKSDYTKLLHQDLNIHKESKFLSKKLKYQNPVSRPASFDAMANTLTRVAGNDINVKEHLIKGFLNEIHRMKFMSWIFITIPTQNTRL